MEKTFDHYFLMTVEDAKRYAVEVLKKFSPEEKLEGIEIGDGNINYVFKIWSSGSGKSVIIKQADSLLRSSGRPLDQNRNHIEAKILQFEGKYAPAFVPEVYYHDNVMAATSMEDVSTYKNLRKELMECQIYPHLAENMAEFLAEVLLPSTDLVMDKMEKKKLVGEFINPQICEITERLVLSDPYEEGCIRNNVFPGNEAFVQEFLYHNTALQSQVALLRDRFMNCAQAMLHGDLHTGSIFANNEGIKVLDPEFAFYGPMGYDIGNIIGNLFFSLANKRYAHPEQAASSQQLEKCIADFCDLLYEKMDSRYDALVQFHLYRTETFKYSYLNSVMADSFGFAGTEMIRRVVGCSKVIEVSQVTDPDVRLPMERALLKMGIWLIMHRDEIADGSELIHQFHLIQA